MDLELAGRVVVVTGASKGIGLACAIAFAREGGTVIGIARDPENLRDATQQVQRQGLALVHPADLKNSMALQAVMDLIENEHGSIEVLVNCADAARRTPPEELDAAALQAAMQSKYFSYMHAIDPVIRRMSARGAGSIVNVIGQGGRQGNPQHIGGGSANAALMLATVGYARAYAGKGVRVNAINPGMTRTGRVDENLETAMRGSGLSRDDVLARQLAGIPMGAWPNRTRSPTWRSFWLRPKQVTSLARSFPWMEGRCRRSERPARWCARGNRLFLVDQHGQESMTLILAFGRCFVARSGSLCK